MIYVEMLGRMGNQMFSYAHARYVQEKYPEQRIGIDFSNFEYRDGSWINYLQYFNCWENVEVAERKMSLVQRIVLRLFYNTRSKWFGGGYKDVCLNELKWAKILELFGLYIFTIGYYPFRYKDHFSNKLLVGFFESSKYFSLIRPVLKEEFKVKNFEQDEIFKEMTKRIESDHSICVGIRKGDFTSKGNINYCDICTPSYYEKGVAMIKKKIVEQSADRTMRWSVYVFTDDVKWAKENIHFEDETIYMTSSVDGEIKPWEMLQVMTHFKYYVIPNSSFFWWAQFLSKEDSPMVVAPSWWRSQDQEVYKDIYEEGWMLLDPV